MTIKYKAIVTTLEIEQVEISHEDDTKVYLLNNQGMLTPDYKKGLWIGYFDTWNEAKEFLIEKESIDLQSARQGVWGAEQRIEYAESLVNPYEVVQEPVRKKRSKKPSQVKQDPDVQP